MGVAEGLGLAEVLHAFLLVALLALYNTHHEIAITALRIETQHLLGTL